MKNKITYWTREIRNWLREKNISALVALLLAPKLLFVRDPVRRASLLTSIFSYWPELSYNRFLMGKVFKWLMVEKHQCSNTELNKTLSNSIILKQYHSKNEKGILLVSFERELDKLVSCIDLYCRIEERYHIVFIPSWTGLFSVPLLKLAAIAKDDFFVMPVHIGERKYARNLGEKCIPLPYNAASWVNADLFSNVTSERDIDCLMVANFAEFKRHWILFKTLRLLPRHVSVVCIGVPWGGRNAEHLRREATHYGVSEQVTIIENPPQSELRKYFKRAKVFCALSFREGSFIAVAEALIAGTPVVMFKNSHIGTKEWISSTNGALVTSIKELSEKIDMFLVTQNHEDIRRDAVARFSSQASSSNLNMDLKNWAHRTGREWNYHIFPIYSMRLAFFYDEESDSPWPHVEEDYSWLSTVGVDVKPH